MNSKKIVLALSFVLAIAPLIVLLFVYDKLPELIPTNWGFNGNIEYSKRSISWVLAIISPICYLLFLALPKLDPKKKNFEKFTDVYHYFILYFMIFMLIVFSVTISEAFYPGRFNVGKVVCLLLGVLFLLLGNIMPKFKSNFFIGIKTPWTLSDEYIWNKTHRLGGAMFFAGGAIIILLALITSNFTALFIAMMTIVAVITLVPISMSYVWFKNKNKEDRNLK